MGKRADKGAGKMIVLSVDTSTMISSCALMEDGAIIGEMNINQQKTHSETLVPMIRDMLEKLDLKPEDIDLYSVGKGPGSFTGLRIGMTTVKTMAQVFKKEIIGVSTLRALAFSVSSKKKIIPLLDARGGRVYYGIYQWREGEIIEISPDELMYLDELLDSLPKEEYIFVGEGARIYEDLLTEKGHETAVESLNSGIGKALCLLGSIDKNRGKLDNPFTLAPEYIRKSQAQRDLEMKEGKSDANQENGTKGSGRSS